ncbi:MAG TPA: hypothetical protein PL155_04455 [Candidatus Omnitrophota bacterium]|nr:hypothetical protein [Candidatus Omnitrophota bacterium]HPD84272.1 hypothetical protein [Candidatus Omnitrophota bacterium]HRZ03128.1 hypothetical protein [Candidatus Omnitrophota bacterium]
MKKTKTSYKGRKCKSRGCKHILSIYNHEAYCRIHTGQMLQEHGSKS